MAIYHFTWDLEFFGYLEPGLTAHGGWKLFARCIASSFLFLVGVSLFLAHGRGIRWRGFLIRFAMVAGAALAISVVTYFAVPGAFIFFGILHEIALASLLGLAFLRLPALVTLIVAAAVIAAPFYRALGVVRPSLAVVARPFAGATRAPTTTCLFSHGSARCWPASPRQSSLRGSACSSGWRG